MFPATYHAKREARLDRMRARVEKLRAFAVGKDLSLFSEERSGIPMGQPILVGHHSERRHRRHLERLENLIRKGYDASKRADQLEERIRAAERDTQIQVDNPDAAKLLQEKIDKLESQRKRWKRLNSLVRKSKGNRERLAEMIKTDPEIHQTRDADSLAQNLLTPDFAGRLGIPSYQLTNSAQEIRRLKQRLAQIPVVQAGFEPFVVNDIEVEFRDGQIQIRFGYKPSVETRVALKGLAFKWSRYSMRWVRKHTGSTGAYFREELKKTLAEAKP